MIATRQLTLLLCICSLPFGTIAQSVMQVQSFGGDVGGTVLGTSDYTRNLAVQYRFFLRHRLGRSLLGELNVGLGFLSNSLQQTRILPLEYRAIVPLQSLMKGDTQNSNITPYLYLGVGFSRFQRIETSVQNSPLLVESDNRITNTAIWNNGDGWSFQLPFGLGGDLRLDDNISLKINAGYNVMLSRNVMVSSAANTGFFGATVGLKFRPFSADWDHDQLSTRNEITSTGTYPDNRDSDADGLFDGEELLKYHTDPLNPDTDGDRLTDGDEVSRFQTNPLLRDTDGGLVSDYREITRGSDPRLPSDDFPRPRLYQSLPVATFSPISLLNNRNAFLFYNIMDYRWDSPATRSGKVEYVVQLGAFQDVTNARRFIREEGDRWDLPLQMTPADSSLNHLNRVYIPLHNNWSIALRKRKDHSLTSGTAFVRPNIQWTHSTPAEELKRIASLMLSDSRVNLNIYGYASVDGDSVLNQTLSNLRAWNIKEHLLHEGVPADRVLSIGRGEGLRTDPRQIKEARTYNRQVNLELTYNPVSRSPSFTSDHIPELQCSRDQPGKPSRIWTIRFSGVSDRLAEEDESYLAALAHTMKKNPGLRLSLSTHKTDQSSVEKVLAEARVARVMSYLVDQGIEIGRVNDESASDTSTVGGTFSAIQPGSVAVYLTRLTTEQ